MPKVVDETPSGEPIFEVQSVRLILRVGAAHFNRVVACAKCGRDVPGPSVLSAADLEHAANPVICKECVKTATAPAARVQPATSAVRRPDGPAGDTAPPRASRHLSGVHPTLADLERRTAELALAQDQINQALDGVVQRMAKSPALDGDPLAVVETRIAEAVARLASQVESQQADLRSAVENRLEQLHGAFSSEGARAGAAVDRVVQSNAELREAQVEISRLGEVTERLAQERGTRDGHVHALEARLRQLEEGVAQVGGGPSLQALHKRIDETVERLTERDEVQAELRVALEGRVDELAAIFEQKTSRANVDTVPIASENQALVPPGDLVRRIDALAERVQQLQVLVEAGAAAAQPDSAQAVELVRIEEQLNERLDRMVEKAARVDDDEAKHRRSLDEQVQEALGQIAEALKSHRRNLQTSVDQRFDRLAKKVARAGDTEAEHRRSLEEQVQDGLGRIAAALESNRMDLQTGLREGLAEVRAAVPTPASVNDDRVQALEERLEKSDYEVSELGELHAALDIGLGALRSEIGEVRGAVQKVTGEQADIQDRRDGFNRPLQAAAPGDSARGWKPGRKAETGSNLAAIEAAEILAREHQQLKAQVADLEKAAEAAAAAAASSQASTSGPLRSDVRLLQEQLAEQNEALAALSRGLERLRRKVSTPAAPQSGAKTSKPARKATKR